MSSSVIDEAWVDGPSEGSIIEIGDDSTLVKLDLVISSIKTCTISESSPLSVIVASLFLKSSFFSDISKAASIIVSPFLSAENPTIVSIIESLFSNSDPGSDGSLPKLDLSACAASCFWRSCKAFINLRFSGVMAGVFAGMGLVGVRGPFDLP
jgi:hypothetical protein